MARSTSRVDADRRLVFQVGAHSYEIDARRVLEVARIPLITRVPHGPPSLAGIANLRGKPLPILSMGRILNETCDAASHAGKIIVYDHGGPVGLLVDEVLQLSADAAASSLKELNGLLDTAFKVGRRASVERTKSTVQDVAATAVKQTALLSFRVEGQLYGLPLRHIREILPFPPDIPVATDKAAVIGLIPMRDGVLTLVSLASLLGIGGENAIDETSRIIVVERGPDMIGLVVDEMDLIRHVREDAIDRVPSLLQRGRGDAQIEAIGRIESGALLISILSPETLFGHHAIAQAIEQNSEAKTMETTGEQEYAFERFLIFQLGDESYGLPIGSVDEVASVPKDVTRIPGAPDFVMGVINLRGRAVPLIDQRARFDTPSSAHTTKVRAIIVTLGGLKAGFVVDSVTEVKSIASAALSAAPEFSSKRTDIFDRIAHIDPDGRMILLIDPRELLTRAERDIVEAIRDEKTKAAGS